jgi:alanine-synthesizing transaminase
VEALARLAERRRLVLFSDEIYDRILYDGHAHVPAATVCLDTLCATFGGLSKVHLACGLRVGWVSVSGRKDHAADYLEGLEVLASLRLCANVPGQWTVPAALAGAPEILAMTAEDGRLGRQRRAMIEGVKRSAFLTLTPPAGALYAFPRVDLDKAPAFDDRRFAMDLLEREHVLVIPGSGFNVPYKDHLRLTMLPDEATIAEVLARMERLLGAVGDAAHR